jgi:hypothetical protein
MKKVLLTVAAIACISVASFSQGRFSIGAELALPVGDWDEAIGLGFGGSVRYEAPINENLSWMGTGGFLSFGEKDDSGLKATMIPVLGGIKYYFTESFNGFYAGAELGVSFNKVKYDIPGFGSGEESSTDFAFGPQVGYHVGPLDISARYFLVEDANSLGFRVAYVLGGN